MASVEENYIPGRLEDSVQSDGHLDYAEVRSEVPPGLRNRVYDELANFAAEFLEFITVE